MELTQRPRTGGFIVSEANPNRSLDNGILASGQATALNAGTVLGQVAAGRYSVFDPAGTDGSQIAWAILYAYADATVADLAIVAVARDEEVRSDALIWPAGITSPQIDAAAAQLNERGIVLR
jgi:hypothetical protein